MVKNRMQANLYISENGNLGKLLVIVMYVLAMVLLAGCAPNKSFRTEYVQCAGSKLDEGECGKHAIQEYVDEARPNARYALGIIEFDNSGILFDRVQMHKVLEYVERESERSHLLMVVFIHGWKHNAEVGDDNVMDFREVLIRISERETALAKSDKLPRDPRPVIGLYLGWRGVSVTLPLIRQVTFWERKQRAHLAGERGMGEVLYRLENIRRDKNAKKEKNAKNAQKKRTRLVIIGHSFGGAALNSALLRGIEANFLQASRSPGNKGPAMPSTEGIGDLVVLINPAFEATRFTTMWNLAEERKSFPKEQRPLLLVLTAEKDQANKRFFPFGRWISTVFQKYTNTEQKKADRRTLGHYEAYITHTLKDKPFPDTFDVEKCRFTGVDAKVDEMENLRRVVVGWDDKVPGKAMEFVGSELTHLADTTSPRNPFLIVRVLGKKIIPNHTDISGCRVQRFLQDFISLSLR